ncbi:MAG: FAD-dependent oxidoreductase [Clostridia bacterium]|nr:FAD-dependent oxidoreductase [Clostridia bacterium]
MAMVKCVVCGAIFDASVKVCPVCGASSDQFVPVEDNGPAIVAGSSDLRYLILGGGPGAFNAAAAIRERDTTGHITILTDESSLPYNRPMLTKALLQDFTNDSFAIQPKSWYEEKNVTVIQNIRVTSIDAPEYLVNCTDLTTGKAEQFVYDRLIYALGAHCFVPPIPGSDRPHVVSIRNIADTEKIHLLLKSKGAKNIVCIGGGVMGLEGAWDLKEGGYNVTVLEGAPGLLPKQFDDEGSAFFEELCGRAGVNIVCNAQTDEITDTDVVLKDGRKFPADLVIMSTGMRPNTKVAEDSGIEVDKFVNVDLQMHTNLKHIYAVGDCVQVNGQPQAFWAQASENGRIAGANAAGDNLTYVPLGSSMVIDAMNTKIFALGTNGKDDKPYTTWKFKDADNYQKFYFLDNKLMGVILIGDTSRMIELTDAIAKQAAYEEVVK